MSLQTVNIAEVLKSNIELNGQQPVIRKMNLSGNSISSFSDNTLLYLESLDLSEQMLTQPTTRC